MRTSVIGSILAFILVAALGYGGWRLERWFHYKFSYQSQVQAEMQPLVNRIADLERRVSAIETNKNQEFNLNAMLGQQKEINFNKQILTAQQKQLDALHDMCSAQQDATAALHRMLIETVSAITNNTK